MSFKTYEIIWFKKMLIVDWFLSFASFFLLFVDLLPSLIIDVLFKKISLCSQDFDWL